MITKKLLLKFILCIAAVLAFFFIARHIGDALYRCTKVGLLVLIIQVVVGYIACAVTLTPVGTTPAISERKIMLVAAGICVIAALLVSGLAGAAGALIGAACGIFYHRSML